MFGSRKISFHFVFLLTLIFPITIGILSHCTLNDHNQLDEATIRNYEIQLDSLIQKTKRLKIDEEPSKFITIWEQSRQILNLLPDSSKQQKKVRKIFIKKLIDVGAYEEAIKQSWQIIADHKFDSINNMRVPNLLVYGTLAGLYNKIGEVDSAYIIYRMAIAKSKHYNNEWRISAPYNNLGMYFEKQGVQDSAMFYYQFADSLLKASPSKSKYWKKF